jgi:hypothetical protein
MSPNSSFFLGGLPVRGWPLAASLVRGAGRVRGHGRMLRRRLRAVHPRLLPQDALAQAAHALLRVSVRPAEGGAQLLDSSGNVIHALLGGVGRIPPPPAGRGAAHVREAGLVGGRGGPPSLLGSAAVSWAAVVHATLLVDHAGLSTYILHLHRRMVISALVTSVFHSRGGGGLVVRAYAAS